MPDREYVVYRLTNRVTGQCYVGVTCMKLRARWWKHTSCARLGVDTLLYLAMREYGAEAFEMTVVRSGVAEANRWTAEREEIARAGSCGGGYNELPGVPQAVTDPGVPVWFSADRPRKTHCKHGHEFTPENTATVKRGRQCIKCRRMLDNARHQRDHAKRVAAMRRYNEQRRNIARRVA